MNNFTDTERNAIKEAVNIAMGSASTALSTLVDKTVNIVSPEIDVVSAEDIKNEFNYPCVTVDVKYIAGLKGSSVYIFKEKDVIVLNNLMNNVAPEDGALELGDIQDSPLGEAIIKMVGFAVTAMSEMYNRAIVISPPSIERKVPAGSEMIAPSIEEETVVQITFRLKVDDRVESSLVQIIPLSLAREMAGILLSGGEEEEVVPEESESDAEAVQTDDGEEVPDSEEYEDEPEVLEEETDIKDTEQTEEIDATEEMQIDITEETEEELDATEEIEINEIEETEIDEPEEVKATAEEIEALENIIKTENSGDEKSPGKKQAQEDPEINRILWSKEDEEDTEQEEPLTLEERMQKLEMVKDIPIELTVVLGENNLRLGDLLSSGKGSVVPLKRYAREPVDIMVNDQLVARGEVVVVDGKLGVRVTSIESKIPKISQNGAAK